MDPDYIETVYISFRSIKADKSSAANDTQDVPEPQRSPGTAKVRADRASAQHTARAHRPKGSLTLVPGNEEVQPAATSGAAPRKNCRPPKAKIGVLVTTRPALPRNKGPGRPRKGLRGPPK